MNRFLLQYTDTVCNFQLEMFSITNLHHQFVSDSDEFYKLDNGSFYAVIFCMWFHHSEIVFYFPNVTTTFDRRHPIGSVHLTFKLLLMKFQKGLLSIVHFFFILGPNDCFNLSNISGSNQIGWTIYYIIDKLEMY